MNTTATNKVTPQRPLVMTEDEYERHVHDYDGVCVVCGDICWGGVEPDAEDVTCEACETPSVMGVEQALLSELVEVVG